MSDPAANLAPQSTEPPLPGLGYRAWFLGLLVLLSASVVSARYVLFVLVEPIRHEFNLTDPQISAVKDLSFLLAYVLAAVPVARLSDTGSRRRIIAVAALGWSAAVMLCGQALGFVTLFAGRFGIGVSESAFSSSSQALIADKFPAKWRGTAVSIFLFGATMGNMIGPSFGGWAAKAHGWRWAFVVAGIPGLILAPLAWFTLRDVHRGMSDGARVSATPPAGPSWASARELLTIPSLTLMVLSIGFSALLTMGMVSWMPAFMARTHGMALADVGKGMGAALFFGSFVGHSLGGPLCDWLIRRDRRWYMWILIVAGVSAALFGYAMLTGPAEWVFPLMFAQFAIGGLSAAPMMAALAALAPARSRATAVTILMLSINVIGFGLGPFFVGALSQWLHPIYGEASLGVAMRWTLLVALPSTVFAWIASRRFIADEARALAALD